MKKFATFFTFLAITTLCSCNVNNVNAAMQPNHGSLLELENNNEKIVREFFDSLGQKDMKLVESYLSDDFSFQNSMNGKRQFGKNVFSTWWYSMVHDALKLEPKIIRIDVMGNTVMFESAFFYKDKNEEVMFKGTSFAKLKDGLITEYQEYPYPNLNKS